MFCWLCPRGLGFSLRNDQARSEKSGRAVGAQGCVVLLQLIVLPKVLQLVLVVVGNIGGGGGGGGGVAIIAAPCFVIAA